MKKATGIVLALIVFLSIFTGCNASVQNDSPSVGNAVIETVSPINATVNLHTKQQTDYLSDSYDSLPFLVKGIREKSRPNAVEFEWGYNGEQPAPLEYILSISEYEDMTNSIVYTTSSDSIAVYNLKIATTYYWTVSVNGVTSDISKFTTDSTAPRNLFVDGITNVRDLGGWETENGSRTKQGLIFRCGRLNESSAETPNIEITENGIKTMRDELKVKTEIDIRKTNNGEVGGITSSPLGNDINYFSCPMEWEGDTFNGNKQELLKVFSILAKEENYPIIFHCNIGTDRTGMIAFLVNALLGVPEESLYRDYLFSNFGNIGGARSINGLKESVYYQSVQQAEGNTLSEKTYNCLLNFGVPKEDLDSIIAILSEE